MNLKSKRVGLGAIALTAILLTAWIGAGAATSSSTEGTLKIGTADSPPWVLFNPKTKKYYGPSITLFNAVAKELGQKVEYVDTGYGTAITALQARQFDVIGLPLFNTPERMKVIDFVLWTASGNCYVALKSNTKVNKYSDFNQPSVTMAVQTGASIQTDFPKKYPKAKVVEIGATGAQPVIQEVISGRVDLTDIDAPLVYKYLAAFPQLKSIPDPATCSASPDFPHKIGMGIRKDAPKEFKAALQKVVNSIRPQLAKELVKYSQPKYLIIPE